MRRPKLWALLTAGALLAAACGNDDDSSAAGPAADGDGTEETEAPEEEEFLDASLAVANSMAHLPVFVAQEFGLWTDRGLNVEIEILPTGADIAAALGAGEVEFAAANAATGIPPQRASGLETQLVAGYNNDATNALYVDWIGILGRADADITEDPESLIGRRVGVTPGGTPAEYWNQWLNQEGFTEDQFDVVTMNPADMPAAITTGEVDAVVPVSPFREVATIRLGDDAVDVSDGEPLVLSAIGLAALEGQVEEQEEIFRRMIEGLVEATSIIRQDPEGVASVVLGFIEGIDEEGAVAAMEKNVFDPRISVCTRYGVEATSERLVREGTIDQTFTADEILDTRLLDEILEANPEFIEDLPPLPENVEDCTGVGG